MPRVSRKVAKQVFPLHEFDRRLAEVRRCMDQRGLRALLIAAPENVYYLTGLEHQGYFAYEMLVVPLEGKPVLITRAMEHATVRDQVPWVHHVGYSDGIEPLPPPEDVSRDLLMSGQAPSGETSGLRPWEMSVGVAVSGPLADRLDVPTRATLKALHEAGLDRGRIGLEMRGSFLPYAIADGIVSGLPQVDWEDGSGLVDDVRLVQSPLEIACTRAAAEVTDSMMLAAVAAAGTGVYEHDVMAALYDQMFRRAGTWPGFVPLVRSTRTIAHEHGTWNHGQLRHKDLLFLEMAGCVRRYHAPAGRLVFIGKAPPKADRALKICVEAMEHAAEAAGPGVNAGEVYARWQAVLDKAGLAQYRRHHCGYAVGIGFPPSWSGSGTPRGLRLGSKMELKPGMVFHLMSWLLRTGKGDAFLSDTVVITDTGCEVLTRAPRSLFVR